MRFFSNRRLKERGHYAILNMRTVVFFWFDLHIIASSVVLVTIPDTLVEHKGLIPIFVGLAELLFTTCHMCCNAIQATITPVTQAIPVSNEASAPAVVPPLPARTATSPAKHAPAATVPKALPATPVKEATAAAKPPASPAAPRASAAPVAPGAGEAKAGNTPADAATAATAAAAAVSPRKEYDVVGGPVSGVAEIVLTGVKGDPEGVIKKIRRRGFVVHLVS